MNRLDLIALLQLRQSQQLNVTNQKLGNIELLLMTPEQRVAEIARRHRASKWSAFIYVFTPLSLAVGIVISPVAGGVLFAAISLLLMASAPPKHPLVDTSPISGLAPDGVQFKSRYQPEIVQRRPVRKRFGRGSHLTTLLTAGLIVIGGVWLLTTAVALLATH